MSTKHVFYLKLFLKCSNGYSWSWFFGFHVYWLNQPQMESIEEKNSKKFQKQHLNLPHSGSYLHFTAPY